LSVHAANERAYDDTGRWRTETYAHAGQVGSTDDTLYVQGDAITDGSLRFIDIDGVTTMQERISGVFVTACLLISSSCYVIDDILAELVLDETGEFVWMDS